MVSEILRHLKFNLRKVVGFEKSISGQHAKFDVKDISEYLRLHNFRGEEKIIQRIIENTEENDIFYDVGANIGTHSCLVGGVSENVIAFEPHPENISQLQRNLKINSINSKIISIALSNGKEIMELSTSGDGAGVGTHSLIGSGGGIKVPTDSLDDILTENDIPKPDVMKMDIEGAEVMALEGMEDSLSNIRYILIEIHENVDKESVIKKLEVSGFSVNCINNEREEVHIEDKR